MGKQKKKTKTKEYIEPQCFAKRYGYKEETIKKNIDKISGAKKENYEYLIPDSARYPYNVGRTSIKTRDDKRYILLKATSLNFYIDEKMIGMSKASFTALIKELIQYGFLLENGSGDKHGVNAYDTTLYADNILKQRKKQAVLEIAKAIAAVAGTYHSQLI
jgi:hypothetical protein